MDNSNQLTTSTDYSRLLVTNTYTIVHTWNAVVSGGTASQAISDGIINGNISHLNISINGSLPISCYGVYENVSGRTLTVMVGLVDGILTSALVLFGPDGSQTITVTYTIIATHPIY